MLRKAIHLIGIVLLLTLLASSLSAQVPRTISYQGRLTNDTGTPLNATYSITFSLYDVATGGTALWSETKDVAVSQGLLSTALGDTAPFGDTIAFDRPYFLGLKLGSGDEMTPRQPFQSAPYALALPGVTVDADGNVIFTGSTPKHIICDGGSVGIGTTAPQSRLHVAGGDVKVQNGGNNAGEGGAVFLCANPGYAPGAGMQFGLEFAGDGVDSGFLRFLTRSSHTSPLVERVRITSGGDVVIGNAVSCGTLTLTSSRRFKDDVKPIGNPSIPSASSRV